MRKLLLLLSLLITAAALQAQNTGYQLPPKDIADLLLAKPTPLITADQKGEWMLLIGRYSYPSVEELAQPEQRIAGLRFNPNNFSPSRLNFFSDLTLKNLRTGKEYNIQGLPAPLMAGNISWNPGETKIAFTNTTNRQVDLYVIDISTQHAAKVNTTPLNTILGIAAQWIDDKTLLYATRIRPASAAPPKRPVPDGPAIQENLGKSAPSPTFEDLIKTPYDEAIFAFYGQAQLVRNSGGVETPVGKPGIFISVSPSPDKKYLLLRTVHEPFSYLVPAEGFNSTVSITDISGHPVRTVIELPSSEGTPRGFDNVQNVPRDYAWRNDQPATLTWCMPLDSGIMRRKTEYHDAVYALTAPFTGEPATLFQTRQRFRRIVWGNDSTALVTEGLRSRQQQQIQRYNPSTGAMTLLIENSTNDAYNDPGFPVLTRNKYGEPVLQTVDHGNKLLLNNTTGSSPQGDLPFLAKFDLATHNNDIVWRCQPGSYEFVAAVIDADKLTVLSRKESHTDVPNYYLKQIGSSATDKAVTAFANPYPQLDGVSRQKVSYKRADGVDLTGDLYLPKGYDPQKDGPLPVLIWAYPREFNSASDAAQVRGSKDRFTTISWASPVFWVTQGYAILDNAEMPIVAIDSTRKPNDDFVHQLTMNAEAAIRQLAAMGVGDSTRVAVGGHSYGAFMTANLLAHTKLFRAGIARSGAYNRTLTPFGFQNEDRTYWEDPRLYYDMSPFMFADKITTPILLIHGEMDDNSGTFPIQSERLYNAIKGNGGTVRYVVLPYEAHGYRGRENLLHLLYEQNAWLEKYVKNAHPQP
ncbi:MAG TPA: prolyl oligopeptidase family serine peptidase [Puia sp.]|jgi:dipeptidyl aminopeptidase/acylaminoacyl peptidase|nr:prolyl oligopeptidase family serine peptidase [Puia sp.]